MIQDKEYGLLLMTLFKVLLEISSKTSEYKSLDSNFDRVDETLSKPLTNLPKN